MAVFLRTCIDQLVISIAQLEKSFPSFSCGQTVYMVSAGERRSKKNILPYSKTLLISFL